MSQHSNTITNISGNLSCIVGDTRTRKIQHNVNNNNNTSSQATDEQNALLHFYVFNVSRERALHLTTNSHDKRLLSFHNISNSLLKIGLRNGDILIYLNGTNVVKPPIALSIDRVKSEFTALRRQNRIIQIGVCRCGDQALLNSTTIKHLGSLTTAEFESLAQENRKSPSDSKKLLNLFSSKKKFTPNSKPNSHQDSGFVETDVDQSLLSNSHKYRSKTSLDKTEEDGSIITLKSFELIHSDKASNGSHSSCRVLDKPRQYPTQIVTDACFIYRRELMKPLNTEAMILRGREIAYEAANSPTIPSSMPNYTHDQIRELYGELDDKTRRLQENEFLLHKPMIDAWKEKSPWIDECPLPKFRLEKNDQTLLSAYLSTGLSNNPRTTPNSIEKESVRGSFRTSIADRTCITPSPLIFNVHLDFNKSMSPKTSKIIPSLAEITELMDIDSLIDLDEETTIPYQTAKELPVETSASIPAEDNLSIDNLIQIVRAIHEFHYVYDETNHQGNLNINESDFICNEDNDYQHITSDIHDEFEELYERYITNFDQYETMMQIFDQIKPKQDLLTPISEESVVLIPENHLDECGLTFTCQRQIDHIGHYGFELEQTTDGKILIASIVDSTNCPDLKIGDEILSINHHSNCKTLNDYHSFLHSLWYDEHHSIQITIRKPTSQPVSMQSSSLSWPLSIAESGKIIAVFFPSNTDLIDL